MTSIDGVRRLPLPEGWKPVEDEMCGTALAQTMFAFDAAGLAEVRERFVAAHPPWPIDRHDLRLLDVVLWMRATR